MVASARTLDSLKTIGLNKYERNLWVALLSRGASTAGELSDISSVPRSRCYDVLESLAERGFVVIQPGKPLKYVSIHPLEALERAKKKIQEDARETGEKIDRLVKSDAVKELEKLHKENIKTVKPEDLAGAIKGSHAVHQHIESMLKKAKKSVKLMTTENGLIELAQQHAPHLKKAAESGVKIQVAAPVTKNTAEAAKELSKYAQVRHLDADNKLGARLCVIDGEEFMFGLTDEKTHPTQDVVFWSQSNHAASQFIEPMFEMAWQNAKPAAK